MIHIKSENIQYHKDKSFAVIHAYAVVCFMSSLFAYFFWQLLLETGL